MTGQYVVFLRERLSKLNRGEHGNRGQWYDHKATHLKFLIFLVTSYRTCPSLYRETNNRVSRNTRLSEYSTSASLFRYSHRFSDRRYPALPSNLVTRVRKNDIYAARTATARLPLRRGRDTSVNATPASIKRDCASTRAAVSPGVGQKLVYSSRSGLPRASCLRPGSQINDDVRDCHPKRPVNTSPPLSSIHAVQ